MAVSASDVIQLGSYAYKLKTLIAEHGETEAKLYRHASNLVSDIDDLEGLRSGHINNSLADLDAEIASLQDGLRDVLSMYEKALKKHQNKSMVGRAKAIINVKKVKEQLVEMDAEVNRIKQKFMVRMHIQQSSVAARQFSATYSVQESVATLQEGMEKLLQDAQSSSQAASKLFGIEQMTRKEKKTALRKTSLELAASSEEADKRTLKLKLEILEGAFKESTDFLAPEKTIQPDNLVFRVFGHRSSVRTRHLRENAVIEVMSLLRSLEDPNLNVSPIIWLKRGTTLSLSLSDLGYHEEALVLSQICYDITRKINSDHPGVYTIDLAIASLNLSWPLSGTGRSEEALEICMTSLALNTKHTAIPGNDNSFWAQHRSFCYGNIGEYHHSLGHIAEAIEWMQKAVDVKTEILQKMPDFEEIQAALTSSLNKLASYLYNSDKAEQGRVFAEKAVDMARALARTNPELYLGDLSLLEYNLAASLSRTGQKEDAIEYFRKAIQSGMENEEVARVDRTRSVLALAYRHLGIGLSELGRDAEAVIAGQNAVEIFTDLNTKKPGLYKSDLGYSHHILIISFAGVGRYEESIESARKAIEIRTALAEEDGERYSSDLALSLHCMSASLWRSGQHSESADTLQKSVDVREASIKQFGGKFVLNAELAGAYYQLGDYYHECGRSKDAVVAARRAVEIWECLSVETPAEHREDIGNTQHRLANYFAATDQGVQAVASSQAAADIWADLIKTDPKKYTIKLIETLFNLSMDLWALNRHSEAIQSLKKCVALQEEAGNGKEQERSLSATEMFANSLFLLSNHLFAVDEKEEAVATMQRAVELRTMLADSYSAEDAKNPAPGHRGNLAEAAHHLGVYLSMIGRYAEAAIEIQKAIDVGTVLAEERPKEERYRTALGLSYQCLCQFLLRLGRVKEAAQAVRRLKEIEGSLGV